MSLQDYASRKYDYLGLQNTKPAGNQLLGLDLFTKNTSGKLCVGVQKLAQRWLLEFMTEKGSMPGLPQRGCSFMSVARRGGFRTQMNVFSAFAGADMEIRPNLLDEEYEGMPDDERLGSATLLSATVIPNANVNSLSGTSAVYLEMSVKITSLAGDEYKVILPIETIP